LEWVSFKAPLVEGKTQSYPLPLAEAIVKLPAGAVSAEPVVVNGQHYILKVDEVRPTTVPKYEQVKDTIRQLLEQQEIERATAALVAGLLKNAKIQQ
ncbi:MAG TPA: peptidyl-prolyl cis-trans isomerase, partial [Verrucomicrobiae bacterium]|nr:peptidyl-prolyl cis-trans isomerase [Verrucomicrobiae bacterium]